MNSNIALALAIIAIVLPGVLYFFRGQFDDLIYRPPHINSGPRPEGGRPIIPD
jgi:hypothetical protein